MLTLLGCTTGGEDWIDIHRRSAIIVLDHSSFGRAAVKSSFRICRLLERNACAISACQKISRFSYILHALALVVVTATGCSFRC